ncbi:MAG: hypothetical protein P8Y76_09540 [bacterium]|jgi:hypothetical protein
MALISLRQLLDHAAEHGDGVPVDAIRKRIRHGVRKARFEAFGCAGQAARIAPLPLDRMVQLDAQPLRAEKEVA